MDDHVIYLYALPFFGVTMGLEALHLWHHAKEERPTAGSGGGDAVGYEPRDTFASLSMGTGYLAIAFFTEVMTIAIYHAIWHLRVVDLPNTVAMWVAAFVVQDLCFYWHHRTSHEVRFFWAAHVNHHSSNHYNLSTALRQSWTEHLFAALFYVPMALLGFPVEVFLVVHAFNRLYQYGVHTESIGRMGVLEWVLNTPSHHRVHHGSNLRYLDKNYAGMLIVWDRMFGTFEPEDPEEPVRYGLTKPLESFNPVTIAFHEWVALAKDVRDAGSWRGRLGLLLRPPGWREDGQHETVRALTERAAQAGES